MDDSSLPVDLWMTIKIYISGIHIYIYNVEVHTSDDIIESLIRNGCRIVRDAMSEAISGHSGNVGG